MAANPSLRLKTITPNWLRVERATIFFKSDSKNALSLAIVIVILPNTPSTTIGNCKDSKGTIRRSKYTPAVTKVDECTNAETGVGAAIAAGSQALKGTCALLVDAATASLLANKRGATGSELERGKVEKVE